MNNTFLWVEKYRPKTIQDCVLPENLKKTFSEFVKNGIPNLLLTGGPGVGKTTVAKAMLEQIGYDYIMINGSEESGIDVLRNKMKNFASTMSLEGSRKFIIIDEADYLNAQSTQPALRGFIEEFSQNCRFILTCNFKNRVIEPLHSRCGVYEFNTDKKTMAQLCMQFMKRLEDILTQENVKYNKDVIAELISKHAPDWRRVLNECQRNSIGGTIDAEVLIKQDDSFNDLYPALKAKDFKRMRTWVVNNIDIDPVAIIRGVYDTMHENVKPESIPQLVIILADYQYKNSFVADHELNMVACLTEIMANVEFK